MEQLWPPREPRELSEDDLRTLYAFPGSLDRPWVKVNFISSADGAVSLMGRAAGLGDANDQRIFWLGRELCDVILIGAGTALVEHYQGIRQAAMAAAGRAEAGLAPVPTIAVVTRRCSVPPSSPLLTDTEVAPIIYTTESADVGRRAAVANAGASVVLAGTDEVDLHAVVADLAQRGLRRIDCEGGPELFGSMIAAGLVDELCLSVAPLLVAGDAGRIAVGGVLAEPTRMRLDSVIRGENMLLLRYLNSRQ